VVKRSRNVAADAEDVFFTGKKLSLEMAGWWQMKAAVGS
jgi:hypothetical protein